MFKQLLVIGPRYSQSNGVGGVVVLFEMFLKELDSKQINYQVIDSNVHSFRNIFMGLCNIYWEILNRFYKASHISIHAQNKDFIVFIPVLVILSKVINKKLSMRKFAGNFIEVYEGSNLIVRWLIRFSLKNADACFFETKYLVDYFKQFNPNTYWFPNVREKPSFQISEKKEFSKKFIFVGQVKKTKGVLDLIEVFRNLPEGYLLDIYGPLEINGFEELIKSYQNISYCGALKANDVSKTMAEYDVFAMPTFHPGEGYPGVIIEAFSVGLPVIATNLAGIKEIVTDGEAGILVEPRDIEAIKSAVLAFNEDNYGSFSNAAFRGFEQFDSEIVTKDFLEKISVF